MTNLNKEKEEIIYELLLSLNNGDSCYASERVEIAMAQYDTLVKNNIITEWCEHDWKPDGFTLNKKNDLYEHKYVCSKCGAVEIKASALRSI